MKTKTKNPPKVTLAYCKKLFKKHKVMGEEGQGRYDSTGYVEITPQVVMDILLDSDENTRIGILHETDEEWWEDGNPRYERWSLHGSVFDNDAYLEKMAVKEDLQDGFEAPFYYVEEWARHDVKALNAIIREHFGVETPKNPEYTSEGFRNKVLLEANMESFCPVCGEHGVEQSGLTEARGSMVTRCYCCSECGSEWEQVYSLQGYQNLKIS